MALVERGEFTVKSNFGEREADPYLEVRIPHKYSGLSPLVFSVHLLAYPRSGDLIWQEILVQHGPADLLITHQLSSDISHRRGRIIHPKSDYLYATMFQPAFEDPENKYKLAIVTTGHSYSTYPHSVRVGERYEWQQQLIDGYQQAKYFKTVFDEGEMRVFEVGNNIKGSNRIALPRDLRPFVGSRDAEGQFIPPQTDLVTAVEFSCYEP